MRLLALCFLCLFALNYCPAGNRAGWFGSVYKITINGTIKYYGKPVEGAKVTLWDDDDPLRGDKYQEMVTGKDGNFLLHGEEKEINGIEPFLEIWHNCVPDTWDPKRSSNNFLTTIYYPKTETEDVTISDVQINLEDPTLDTEVYGTIG